MFSGRHKLFSYSLTVFVSVVLIFTSFYFYNNVDILSDFSKEINLKAQIGDIDSGLVIKYLFDEGSGNTISDSSGNKNNGLITGNVQWVNGKSGNALSFGTDLSYVSVPYNQSLSITDNITISLWINPRTFFDMKDSYFRIIKKGVDGINSNFHLIVEGNVKGRIYFYGAPNGKWFPISDGYILPKTNEWYLLTVSYNSSTGGQLYINGKPVGSRLNSGKLFTDSSDLYLRMYDGLIDDFRIYNRELSADEIFSLFNQTQPFHLEQPQIQKINETDSISYNIPIYNPGNLDINWSADSLPSGANLDPNTGVFTWTPQYGQAGDYKINIIAKNGTKTSSTNFNVIVRSVSQHFSCINDEKSYCIMFGSGEESARGITYDVSRMGPTGTDGDIVYKPLLPTSKMNVYFPAFNVDDSGLPLSPMLLEIKYKDVINTKKYSIGNSPHQANVYVWNIYSSKNNPFFSSSNYLANLAHMGNIADGQWKQGQWFIPKNAFSPLKANNGKFRLHIVMPNDGPDDLVTELPISYISLRAIDQSEYNRYYEQLKNDLLFVKVDPPNDFGADWNGKELVTFIRDPMRPVYSNTKPSIVETEGGLSFFSSRGDFALKAFGLYSDTGIDNISIDISDLRKQDGNRISSSFIKMSRVLNDERQLFRYSNYKYSNIPDRLESFSNLRILPKNSQSIWLEIMTPRDQEPGIYLGTINIRHNGSSVKVIPIRLEVMPIVLDKQKFVAAIQHGPLQNNVSADLDKVINFYKDNLYDAIFSLQIPHVSPVVENNNIIDFNTDLFERQLRYLNDKSLLVSKTELYVTPAVWSNIYKITNGRDLVLTDPNMSSGLANPNFIKAVDLMVKKLDGISSKFNTKLYFWPWDEPCGNAPYQLFTYNVTSIIKAAGGSTLLTYGISCDERVGNAPPITNLIDLKMWAPAYFNGVSNGGINNGWYYPEYGYLRNPIYNRFTYGLAPWRTGVSIVHVLGMDMYVNDPYNDFDYTADSRNTRYTDWILAYPTWSGDLIPTLGSIGIREGILDARFITTLERLISENPDNPASKEAKNYLNTLRNKIKPDFFMSYFNRPSDSMGYSSGILKDISDSGLSNDFEAFSSIREKVANYIMIISTGKGLVSTPVIVENNSNLSPIKSDLNPENTNNKIDYNKPIVRATDGLCGSTLNSCKSGILRNVEDSSSQYLWMCLGSNSGFNANCSLNRFIQPSYNSSKTVGIVKYTAPLSNKSDTIKYNTVFSQNEVFDLSIPTTTIEIVTPAIPSWFELMKGFINKFFLDIARGAKRTSQIIINLVR